METFLHHCEAEPCGLLLLPDSLQLSPPHLLGNTWTLLPLLDSLGEDLIDTTEGQRGRERAETQQSEKHTDRRSDQIHCLLTLNCGIRLTWRRVSCRSPQSSIWSSPLLVGHIPDLDTASEPRPPPWARPLLHARCAAHAPCDAALLCDDEVSPPLLAQRQTSTGEVRCVSDIISDIICGIVHTVPPSSPSSSLVS